jgi:hypothetical protein
MLALALYLATAPADAPAADVVVTRTAILETTDGRFLSRGRGVWLSEATALARARELDGYRARMALEPQGWIGIALAAVNSVLQAAATALMAWRGCLLAGLCR